MDPALDGSGRRINRWQGAKRQDGYAVVRIVGGGWAIQPPDDGIPAIDRCPCCERPLGNPMLAKLVCDLAFPPPEEPA